MTVGWLLATTAVLAALGAGLLVAQGIWVRRRTPPLPEPPGPREGSIGSGPVRLTLLVCGESPAAGVGVDHQSRGLAASLATILAKGLTKAPTAPPNGSLRWVCVARNGLRIHELPRLLDECPVTATVVVVAMGVNDAKAGVSARRWQALLAQLTLQLEHQHPEALLVFSGPPDLARFPALPWPLRWILGWRSGVLDRGLTQFCTTRSNCLYHPTEVRDQDDFADDGFHPGPDGVAAWSGELAGVISAALRARLESS